MRWGLEQRLRDNRRAREPGIDIDRGDVPDNIWTTCGVEADRRGGERIETTHGGEAA